jgi:serine/threonine-protein kinase
LISTPANELTAVVSPDGHWLAYQSDESGRAEIYVRPFPDVKGHKSLVSVDGGHSPRWSHDGRELFFMNGPNLIAAPVTVQRGVFGTSTTPSVLFSGPFDTTQDNNYDVMPDGSGFIMVEGAPTSTLRGLQVVLHWADEIQRSFSSRSQ